MSRAVLHHFPELSRLMLQREQEANFLRNNRSANANECASILRFWQKLASRIRSEDDVSNMSHILRELKSDIDLLHGLRQSISISGHDPEMTARLEHLVRLIAMLMEIYGEFERWHWHLRDRALAYYLAVNPAIPSKAKEKNEAEKDARKKGQNEAKRVLDLQRKEKKAPKKQKKP